MDDIRELRRELNDVRAKLDSLTAAVHRLADYILPDDKWNNDPEVELEEILEAFDSAKKKE